ncbi:hypothetical protein JCGZ_23565 [Jatropha curcas]|uniref:Uncharacterized protein n=1 Tax=Jatropha curcas TaxID=180498 RepID=A0A067JIQ9_JATCU|nr:hypothetical protein JCGZ_23565 [Jatropha curcas]
MKELIKNGIALVGNWKLQPPFSFSIWIVLSYVGKDKFSWSLSIACIFTAFLSPLQAFAEEQCAESKQFRDACDL